MITRIGTRKDPEVDKIAGEWNGLYFLYLINKQ